MDSHRYLEVELQYLYVKRGTNFSGLLSNTRTEVKMLTPDSVVLWQYPLSHLIRSLTEWYAINDLRKGKLSGGRRQDTRE